MLCLAVLPATNWSCIPVIGTQALMAIHVGRMTSFKTLPHASDHATGQVQKAASFANVPFSELYRPLRDPRYLLSRLPCGYRPW